MNTKIFISTYKDFTPMVKSTNYQVIDSRNIEVPSLKLDDKFYSELYQYRWIYDNLYDELPQYVGFCHYRKYFSFFDNIPTMTDEKCIIVKPLYFNCSVKYQYGMFHNIEDLEIVENIIKEKYNEYVPTMEKYFLGNKFIQCNMFVIKKELFKDYINFIFGVLDEYIKIIGCSVIERINNNKTKYLKPFYPNSTIDYQYRIGGYLAERLTGIFLLHNFKHFEEYEMIVSEKKY